jgi:hypothetical protein
VRAGSTEASADSAPGTERPPLGFGEVLRVKAGRVRLWAVGLFLIGTVPVITAPVFNWNDWGVIWSAGATAGGPDLVDAGRHVAWQLSHGVPAAFWSYPPGTAWLFKPFSLLPVAESYWVEGAVMIGCLALAGLIAARVYGLRPGLAVLAALAWAPSTAALVLGQNTPLALLMAMVAIWALANDRPVLAGLAVGGLLYKPTLALGLLFLLLVRGRWRELGVVLCVGVAGFVVSVAAAGGDWGWLSTWLEGARVWLPADAARNADKAISLPGLLERLSVPWFVPVAAGVVLVLAAARGLRQAGIVEAASAACLLGLAAGPRVWGYEAALAFPFVCWVLGGGGAEAPREATRGAVADDGRSGPAPGPRRDLVQLAEPWRTRLVVAAYLLGPLWLVSSLTQVSAVAVVILGAGGWWIWRWQPLPARGWASLRVPARRLSAADGDDATGQSHPPSQAAN